MLDFRLALRMLARYPLLTIIGSAGMAFGLAAGVGGFEIRAQLLNPALPLDDGARIVGLRNWDIRAERPVMPTGIEFKAWSDRLHTIQELGAAALVEHNLTFDGYTEPISVAELTASSFRIARVTPVLGRTLVDADEAAAAPRVVVIGYSLWQRRFGGDAAIVGRSVRLGSGDATIVGVMPERFGFPVAHEVWTPLRAEARRSGADQQPLVVFGLLARGVSRTAAQAELAAVGMRMAADTPATHGSLRPEIVPYSHLLLDPRNYALGVSLANIFLITLIVVVYANVSLLTFARAASRESEIGVRNALGASRGRIVAQLFVEALVLSAPSVALGLAAARYALGSFWRMYEADTGRALPFWMNDGLTPSTVAYAAALSILGAIIIGVLPALKVTGRGLQAGLRQSAGAGGYRFGGVWTAVIVAQVAVTATFPATAFFFHRWVVQGQTSDVGFPAHEHLAARLVADQSTAADGNVSAARAEATFQELRRQLSAEPGVSAVAFADRLPGMLHAGARFEVEGDDRPPTYGYQVRVASVDTSFFDAFEAQALSGRLFTPTDAASSRDVVVVNTSFVDRVLRGRNAVGLRIRRAASDSDTAPRPWIEIVGVVRDLGMMGNEGIGLYRPMRVPSTDLHAAVRVAGAPELFADRLRAVAARIDPTLRVHDLMPLDRVGADLWLESQYLSRLLTVLSGIALLLSLMAIYAVMAFTVVPSGRERSARASPWAPTTGAWSPPSRGGRSSRSALVSEPAASWSS